MRHKSRSAWPSTKTSDSALMISSRAKPSSAPTTAVEASLTKITWSMPTRLNAFSSPRQPWISWALIIAVKTWCIVIGARPAATARRARRARPPVGPREDGAEIVRWMPPFGRQPAIVETEPADHRANVKSRLHRIELIGRSRHARAMGDDGAGHDRAEQSSAGRIFQRRQPAAERVDQAVARRLIGQRAIDPVIEHIVGDVNQYRVRSRAVVIAEGS